MAGYTEPLLGGNSDSVYNRKPRTVVSVLTKWVPIVVSIVLAIYILFQSNDGNGPVSVDVKQKKNIIFMVTDGMGPASVSLARSFRQYRDHLPFEDVLTIDQYFIGSSRTRSNDSLVTDSAAGATAFSCGLKTYNGAVGVDAEKVPCGTILEALKLQGYLTGLVVTTRITDATPAAFSSHVDYRFQEDTIAQHQLGEYPLGRSVDLILGGGRCHFLPTSEGGCRADKRNLIQEYNDTWSYVGDRAGFDELKGGKNVSLPLLGLLANSDIPYDIDRDEKEYPSLAEQVKVALTALSEATKDSDRGFFLLIEGSRIDHAGHHNDPAAQVREVLAYDKAFKEVIDFIDSTDVETVAISTSDHETGGLVTARQVTSGYPDYLWYPEILLNSKHSGEFLAQKIVNFSDKDDVKSFKKFITHVFEKDMGINDYTKEEIALVIKNSNNANDLLYVLNDIISFRSQTGWTTHGHSAVDVNIYGHTNSLAIKQRLLAHKQYHGLSGNHENIEIGAFLESITGSDLDHITKLVKDTYHSPSAKEEELSVNQFQHNLEY
jgi:alkaline phosphatase